MAAAVHALHELGLEVAMLTGDNEATARAGDWSYWTARTSSKRTGQSRSDRSDINPEVVASWPR